MSEQLKLRIDSDGLPINTTVRLGETEIPYVTRIKTEIALDQLNDATVSLEFAQLNLEFFANQVNLTLEQVEAWEDFCATVRKTRGYPERT